MTAPSEDLLYSVDNGIAKIVFNRPQARNAMLFSMYERMAEICQAANEDHSIKAIILTGAGDKAFASGTDISQFREFKTAQDALDYEARIDRVLTALETCRVPTIAPSSTTITACCGSGWPRSSRPRSRSIVTDGIPASASSCWAARAANAHPMTS